MARKSRKKIDKDPVIVREKKRKNHVGIYIRLSAQNNGYGDDDSILNQEQYLKGYLEEHKDELELIDTYIDNGTTGTNFHREGWNCLMDDIRSKKVDCILVKDLSRLGRNYIEVGEYVETVFPFLGVRVIAVNDSFDSQKKELGSEIIQVSLTNIVNEYYAKDISKKTSSAKQTLRERGEYGSGVVPYGYKKSKENRKKFEVDPGCEKVVQKIFEWRVQGKGCGYIAGLLNELCIPSPGQYRFHNGETAFARSANTKWKSKHIAGILKDPVYLGHMVQGKTRCSYFENNGKARVLPKDEWCVVKNTHPPLITQKQFDISSSMAEESLEKHHKDMLLNSSVSHIENPLRKKIFCGECGRLLTRRSRVINGCRQYTFYCSSKKSILSSNCTSKYIQEDSLLAVIRKAADQELRLVGPLIMRYKAVPYNKEEKRRITRKLAVIKKERIRLYADMQDGKQDPVIIGEKREALYEKQEMYEKELKAIEEKEEKEQKIKESIIGYRERLLNLSDAELPLDLLDLLIEKITVYSIDRIEVTFGFRDIFTGGK